ncbi:mitochondrial matrix Mmp37 [Acrodontium crateriforme]|uniref:Phosphatidate cytidylyltransferase, mitochondrial n=1 Tax=Acrodontium crateriforme TaxID=150365 RepID=A0AAQ3M223_9PEZI|nr:mitochondrial matrix Mmp37 [Acrodontium crateriforme]
MRLPHMATLIHGLPRMSPVILRPAPWQHRYARLRPSSLRPTRSLSATSRQLRPELQTNASSDSSILPPSSPSSSYTSKSTDSSSASSRQSTASSSSGQKQSLAWDSPSNDYTPNYSMPAGWEDNPDYHINKFSQLPHGQFGYNQHIRINEDFKEALRNVLWQFRAPIRYAFAYGSGVFAQKSVSGLDMSRDAMSPHPNPPKAVEDWQKGGAKIIDFIFGVSHTQHWHSINLQQHPDHYSGLKYLPFSSGAISYIQDRLGAGVYFNPFITVNGIMIKYGVVNLDTLSRDLSDWNTLYLAGRLQKPVKILRDHPAIRLANQVNLISAVRTALLMLPEKFTERQLYERIAGLSYMGDPRMNSLIASENPNKVSNIVGAQLPGFRQLYTPLLMNLPNVQFNDPRVPKEEGWEKLDAIKHTGINPNLEDVLGGETGLQLVQDMDPYKRGNMVRRLPQDFRRKLYYKYKSEFGIPGSAFSDILESAQDQDPADKKNPDGGAIHRREGGEFEQRIASHKGIAEGVGQCVHKTVAWPATTQTIKSFFTAGAGKAWKYYSEKRKKGKQIKKIVDEDKDGEKKE